MFSLNAGINTKLFQLWQSSATSGESQRQTVVSQSEFIELPEVHCYEELETHVSFPQIKSCFLSDIQEMKQRVHSFVSDQYDESIDAFHNKLKDPPEYLKNSLLPLYRETRFQIHQLVRQLRAQQNDANADNKNYIASVLHDCLNGIEFFPAGVHSRFSQSFLDFEASRAGLEGKLFKVRRELFCGFIQSFLFEQQREELDIPKGMEVHWFNSVYNLFCKPLGLPFIVDPAASTSLCDDLTQRLLSAVPLSVNACTILRKLSSEWADQLSTAFQKIGVSAWETKAVAPGELTLDRTEELESMLLRPVNYLLKTTEEKPLDLWVLLEELGDGNYYFGRYREKLLAWVVSHFSESSAQVFTAIAGGTESVLYIGTINGLFFWVFKHDQLLPSGQACHFNANNHITLTLPHLTSIDFSTWPEITSYALLTQAMEQTNKAEHIASFFLQHAAGQLRKTPVQTIKALSSQLCDKLIKHGDTFKENLCQCVCDCLACDPTLIHADSLEWLVNTPLVKQVLLRLQQQGMDVLPITQKIASWQISDFSSDDMNRLLTPVDCQRLFMQAFRLQQAETLANLLLTGHCDQLTNCMNSDGETPLAFFARFCHLSGLEYLLQLDNPKVNQRDNSGFVPLNRVAKHGHTGCLRALLATDGIDVHQRTDLGWTPLMIVARYGHAECLRMLLAADDTGVNASNKEGWTPLMIVARYGYAECLRMLLAADDTGANASNKEGWTPLTLAARYGHVECVRALLTARSIDVNRRNRLGNTALSYAAGCGQVECVRVLLAAYGINVNKKNSSSWTPLHHAAKLGQVECIKVLLAACGIDVNKNNGFRWTPLHFAAARGHAECVRVLLNADGIQVNKATMHYSTPLLLSIKFEHIECARLLIDDPRTNLNKISLAPDTALTKARRKGFTEIVNLLEADSRLSKPIDRVMRVLR